MTRMFSEGTYNNQIGKVGNILRSISLLDRKNGSPDYTDIRAATMKRLTYREQYEKLIVGNYFNFLLTDKSLLQFKRWEEDGHLMFSYLYYECPRLTITYEDFVYENFQATADEAGDDWQNEYETYLTNLGFKETVTPIRYDYNPRDYSEGVHPIAHLHVGHKNEIRVATRNILRPMSFLLLILRQCYPITWKRCLGTNGVSGWCKNIRTALDVVPPQFWKAKDIHQLHLA